MSLDRHFKQGPMFGCSDASCCGVYPPEDTDHCPECMVEWPCEVEELRQSYARMVQWHDMQHARAERAEAELFAVKAYAAELIDTLARVRTLCDGPNDCKSCSAYSNIRAALEGGAE